MLEEPLLMVRMSAPELLSFMGLLRQCHRNISTETESRPGFRVAGCFLEHDCCDRRHSRPWYRQLPDACQTKWSIANWWVRRNSSHCERVKTPVVVPTAWTQLAPRALARRRQSSVSRPSSRPAM